MSLCFKSLFLKLNSVLESRNSRKPFVLMFSITPTSSVSKSKIIALNEYRFIPTKMFFSCPAALTTRLTRPVYRDVKLTVAPPPSTFHLRVPRMRIARFRAQNSWSWRGARSYNNRVRGQERWFRRAKITPRTRWFRSVWCRVLFSPLIQIALLLQIRRT